jgi:transcriptional regulator with XRE-family HTH domain
MHPLERARAARDWTRAELAGKLRRLGAERGIAVGTGKDGIWRWEHGRRPDRLTQSLLASLLGIPPAAVDERSWPQWLSADPAQQAPSFSWDRAGAIAALDELARSRDMDRRNFILVTGNSLTASLLSWLTRDPAAAGQIAAGGRIGAAAVDHIERRVRELRRTDDADGGGQLIAEASASLGMVVTLLKERTYTDAQGSRLHAAAADFARIRAWAAFDVHDMCADTAFEGALRAAHAAADPALGAHILAFWSIAAHNCGRPADAEAMTAAALAAVRHRTTPRVEAMLYSRRARARAHLRDTRCWNDLGRAADLLDSCSAGRDDDPDWAYWFDRSELLGTVASTHLDFDQPRPAEQAFIQAAALFPQDRVRTHALFLVRQADAQWRQNDIERACATAGRALDLTAEISSHRSTGPLRALSAAMTRRETIPAVREFRERAAQMLTVA